MSEGGQFPWKRQTVVYAGPTTSYANLQNPLPPPPAGQEWHYDRQTREWSLVANTTAVPAVAAVVQASTNNEAAAAAVSLDVDPSTVPEAKVVLWEEEPRPAAVTMVVETKKKDEPWKICDGHILHTINYETDTFLGICLRYQVTPTAVRRANGGLTGTTNLHLLPNPLKIPFDKLPERRPEIVQVHPDASLTRLQKISRVLQAFSHLSRSEATAYLELNDWNLNEAYQNIRQDMKLDAATGVSSYSSSLATTVRQQPGAARVVGQAGTAIEMQTKKQYVS